MLQNIFASNAVYTCILDRVPGLPTGREDLGVRTPQFAAMPPMPYYFCPCLRSCTYKFT